MRVPRAARRAADGLLLLTAVSIPLSTTGMEVGVAGLAALSAAAAVAGWGVVRRTPLDGALAIFFGTLAVSTLVTGDPRLAVGWTKPWVVVGYFGIYWWLRDRAHAARFAAAIAGAGALVAAYGILQHFTGADWYRALLGRPTRVRPREAADAWYAVVGFFRSYLTFAHVMVFPLAWAAAFAMRGRRLALAAAVLVVVAIVFSTARGAWLATLAACGTLWLVDFGRPGSGAARRRIVGVLAVGAATVAAIPPLREQVRHMFDPAGANAGRMAIYRTNLEIVHDHPVFGLGFGRYAAAARPYYGRHPAADRRSHAHSNYLQLAAEVGLAGLAAFGLLYATALLRGWPAVAGAGDAATWGAAAGAWAGVVGFLVGGLTQYNFGDNEVALAMWAALAVLMRCRDG
ncbi:MAG TPA: O-antigen ligase family protein [Candidatus Binatia bacterium]|nr:O-antigen ligase family protein [Candidatus Binatia bacterium]